MWGRFMREHQEECQTEMRVLFEIKNLEDRILARKVIDVYHVKNIFCPMLSDHIYIKQSESLEKSRIR